MIYTVTLNPAIDVSLHVTDGLMPGSINKSYGMRTDPGGKGINVSKTLKAMGVESVVCAGLCGEDGKRLSSMLKKDFEVISITYPAGNTRTNIKISGDNGVTTDINGKGPMYDKASVEGFKKTLLERLVPGDIVVISGRPPMGSPDNIYADLIKAFKAVEGVKVILDCSESYLREGLLEKPYAVKPTMEELGLLNGREEALDKADSIVSSGVSRCLISMGKDGAVFAEEGKKAVYSPAIDVKVNCTTGCGDAMTAGLAYAAVNDMSSEGAFRMCMALASAEAETEGTYPPDKDRVMEIYNSILLLGQ